jgi:hypothetical protein
MPDPATARRPACRATATSSGATPGRRLFGPVAGGLGLSGGGKGGAVSVGQERECGQEPTALVDLSGLFGAGD